MMSFMIYKTKVLNEVEISRKTCYSKNIEMLYGFNRKMGDEL